MYLRDGQAVASELRIIELADCVFQVIHAFKLHHAVAVAFDVCIGNGQTRFSADMVFQVSARGRGRRGLLMLVVFCFCFCLAWRLGGAHRYSNNTPKPSKVRLVYLQSTLLGKPEILQRMPLGGGGRDAVAVTKRHAKQKSRDLMFVFVIS